MAELLSLPAAIFDTSVIVKGLVPPRRKKKDSFYEQQQAIHLLCSSLLQKVEQKETCLIIPSIALVETAAVVSRLTNDSASAQEAVQFLRGVAKNIIYDYVYLQKAIGIGIETKASGFDVAFLTCSKMLNTSLVTDDEKLATIAKKSNITCIFIRDYTPV